MKRNDEKRLSNAWFGGYGHRYDRKAHNKPFRRKIKEQLKKVKIDDFV